VAQDEATARDRELELKSAEDKQKQFKKRAYGGQVTNQRELQGLEMEIAALGRTKDRLDTVILELYEAMERKAAAVKEQEDLLARLRAELEQVRSTYQAERQRLEGELARLQGEREGLASQIQPRLLKRYDDIRARAGNLGIVALADGVCTGCNVAMPRLILERIKKLGGEEFCESCKRYLYLPGEPHAPPSAPAEETTDAPGPEVGLPTRRKVTRTMYNEPE
jgi:hypothetical protein